MYSKIFKQAFSILKTHKFLWGLGLFLVLGDGVNLVSYNTDKQESTNLTPIFNAHPAWVIGFFLICVLGVILFVGFYFRAKAGIILAIQDIVNKKDTGFSKAWKGSKKYYWPLFKIWALTILILMISLAILVTPIYYLTSIHLIGRAAIIGILAFIIFVPMAVILGLINNIAPIFLVSNDLDAKKSITVGFDMVKKFWPNMIMFSFLLGLLSVMASYVLAALASSAVVILGNLSYDTAGSGSIIGGIIAVVAFLFFAGGIASFQQICWVLLFNDLVKPPKVEEEVVVPMPEVIT